MGTTDTRKLLSVHHVQLLLPSRHGKSPASPWLLLVSHAPNQHLELRRYTLIVPSEGQKKAKICLDVAWVRMSQVDKKLA
jgi:hypothetical protein